MVRATGFEPVIASLEGLHGKPVIDLPLCPNQARRQPPIIEPVNVTGYISSFLDRLNWKA